MSTEEWKQQQIEKTRRTIEARLKSERKARADWCAELHWQATRLASQGTALDILPAF